MGQRQPHLQDGASAGLFLRQPSLARMHWEALWQSRCLQLRQTYLRLGRIGW